MSRARGRNSPKHVPQAGHVGLVREQAVREQEARPCRPGVGREAALAPQLGEVLAVHDGEGEAELGLELVLPLRDHASGRGDEHEVDPTAQQHLAQDQAGLDRLAQAHVVGDQQVDARKAQRLAQGQELIGVEPDAGAERGLEQVAIGSGRGVPLQSAEVGGEGRRIIRPAPREVIPAVSIEPACVQLGAPGHL